MDKILYEIKDLFAGRWDAGSVGTFINGVHDEIDWTLIWSGEHLNETLCQITVDGLTRAFVVCHVETGENVAEGIRTSGKLE